MRKKNYSIKNDYDTLELIEYRMAKELAEGLLKSRSAAEKKIDPQKYLTKLVNDEFGVKGVCVSVIYD